MTSTENNQQSTTTGTQREGATTWVFVPLCGVPCAICGQPATFMDTHRYVHHVDRLLRPHYVPALRQIEGEQ